MNIVQIAELCHEVNRGYCESIGDYSQNKWNESPSWQKESAIAGVKYHIENDVTPEASHNNWMKQKIEDGWIYGETKDIENKTHPCILLYEQLPLEQRTKDYLFKAICDYFKSNI
ncbi:RyR domain-containing protein [Paenibacillus sp. NRS-1775]|uniref:RyR domain-containing protein n=1 Tax=unclassified Paenibacillus TaxID=185978 RepID=UPI003D2A87A5